MAKTISFEARNYSRLNNALNLRLHKDAYEAIATADTTLGTLNITNAELLYYGERIELLGDITKEAEKSVDTQRLGELDAQRDKTITHIFALVRAYTDSPIEAEADAAAKLVIQVDKYKGLQKEALIEESTHIDSMLFDMQKFASDVTTLHLDAALAKLEEQNENFKQLYTARRQEQTATALPPAKQVRTEIDKILDGFLNAFTASHLLSRSDDDKQKIEKLATELNSIFKDVKRVANQKAAQKKQKES